MFQKTNLPREHKFSDINVMFSSMFKTHGIIYKAYGLRYTVNVTLDRS